MDQIKCALSQILDIVLSDAEDKEELEELFLQAIQFFEEELVENEFMTEEESRDYCERVETAFNDAMGDEVAFGDNDERNDLADRLKQAVDIVPCKLSPPPPPPPAKPSKSATAVKWLQDPAEVRAASEYANAFR